MDIFPGLYTGYKPFICTKCYATFYEQSQLDVHQLKCSLEVPWMQSPIFHQIGNLMSQPNGWENNQNWQNQQLPGQQLKSELTSEDVKPDAGPYISEQLSRAFRDSLQLNHHLPTHSGVKPYSCSECHKSFAQKSTLKTHLLVHTGEKAHQCLKCNKSFKQRCSLKTHMVVHTGERAHQCLKCNKSFTQSSSLKTHMVVHTGERAHQCLRCNKSFTQSSSLKTHQVVHTGERPHSCTKCHKTYKQSHALKTHLLVHSDEKPYSCTKCHKTFRIRFNLKKHERIHTGEKPFKCAQCEVRFRQKSTLKRHLQVVHTYNETSTGDKLIQEYKKEASNEDSKDAGQKVAIDHCYDEGKRVASDNWKEDANKVARDNWNEESDKPMSDNSNEERKKTLSDRSNEESNKPMSDNSNEESNKPSNEESNKVVSDNFIEENNKETKGDISNKKQHQCLKCYKSFSQRTYLNIHQVVHTGEKPHSCIQCHKTFTQKSSLRTHLSVHTGEKPYSCTECPKTFRLKDHLKKHELVHNNRTPKQEISNIRHIQEQSDDKASIDDKLIQEKRVEAREEKGNGDSKTEKSENCHEKSNDYTNNESKEAASGDNIKQESKEVIFSDNSKQESQGVLIGDNLKQESKEEVSCNKCQLRFKGRRALKRHELTHNEEQRFACSKCDLTFKFRGKLARHELTHTSDVPDNQCEKPLEKALQNNDLPQLKAEIINEMKTEPFDVSKPGPIGENSRTDNDWADHPQTNQLMHNGERPFPCPVCGKAFKESAKLKLHLMTHSGEKPFPCTICDKRFKEPSKLRHHMWIHTGEKPFHCTKCDRRFRDKSKLNKHQQKHSLGTQEMPEDKETGPIVSKSGQIGENTGTYNDWTNLDKQGTVANKLISSPNSPMQNQWSYVDPHYYKVPPYGPCPSSGYNIPKAISSKEVDVTTPQYKQANHVKPEGVHEFAHTSDIPYMKNQYEKPLEEVKNMPDNKPQFTTPIVQEMKAESIQVNRLGPSGENTRIEDNSGWVKYGEQGTVANQLLTYPNSSVQNQWPYVNPWSYNMPPYESRQYPMWPSTGYYVSNAIPLQQFEATTPQSQPKNPVNPEVTNQSSYSCTPPLQDDGPSQDLEEHQPIQKCEQPFACNTCHKTFSSIYILQAHEVVHSEGKQFVCSQIDCNKSFSNKGNLQRHQLTHTDERAFACNKCNKTFKTKYHLKTHEATHSRNQPLVNSESTTSSNLNRSIELTQNVDTSLPHIESKRETIQFPNSHSSGYSTSNSISLYNSIILRGLEVTKPQPSLSDNHVNPEGIQQQSSYSDTPPLKESGLRQDLGGHRPNHKDIKPMACDTCHKTFRDKWKLNAHEMVHSGKRPFVCNHGNCDKAFASKSNLQRHQLCHTGERPFACHKCDKTFKTKCNLKKHEAIHSSDEPLSTIESPTSSDLNKSRELTHNVDTSMPQNQSNTVYTPNSLTQTIEQGPTWAKTLNLLPWMTPECFNIINQFKATNFS